MTANITARYTKVTVGGLDVSPGLVSFEASDQPISESGLVLCQGRLVLKPWVGSTVNFDPDLSPVWNIGSPVLVDIQDNSGAFIRHPRGYLRISKASWNWQTNTLELSLVDTLGLLSYRTPPEDASNVCLGSNASVQAIANTLLSRSGAPSLHDGVPGSLNYPIPKLTGSFIAQLGQLLFSFGHFAWVDNLNRVRATPIMSEAGALVGIGYLGRSEVSFESLGASESATEIVKVAGVGKRSLGSNAPQPQVSREYAKGLLIREVTTEVIPGLGTTISMATLPLKFSIQGLALCKLIRTTVRGQLKEVMPKGSVWANSSLLARLEVTEEYTFKHPKTEAVMYSIRYTSRPIAAVLSGSTTWRNSTALTGSDLTETLYEINPTTGEYSKITTLTSAKAGGLFPDTRKQKDNNSWVTAKKTTEAWVRQGRLNVYNVSIEAAKLITKTTKIGNTTTTSESIVLAPQPSPSRSGNSGEAQPPAVSYCEFGMNACGSPRVEMEDVPLEGVAYFASTFGQTYQQRETNIEAKYASNQGQLTVLARQWGRLLWARAKGVRFAVEINDNWLTNWKPLLRYDWVDPTGIRKAYLCEAQSWVSLADQALVSADGLYLGNLGSMAYPSQFEAVPAMPAPLEGYPDPSPPEDLGSPTPTPPADPPDPPVSTPLPPVPLPVPPIREIIEVNLGLSFGLGVEVLEYSTKPKIFQADLGLSMGLAVTSVDGSMFTTVDLSIGVASNVSRVSNVSMAIALGAGLTEHTEKFASFPSGSLGAIDRFLKVYGDSGSGLDSFVTSPQDVVGNAGLGFQSFTAIPLATEWASASGFQGDISPNVAVLGSSGSHGDFDEGLGAGLLLPDGSLLSLPDGSILIIEPLV